MLGRLTPSRMAKRLVEALTKRRFRNLVSTAYAHRDGDEHQIIAAEARRWFGVDAGRGGLLSPAWFMDFVFQVQRELRREGESRDLGPAAIGFESLTIRGCSGDANSSQVYLCGFSDNAVSFAIYRRYAAEGSVALDIGANLGVHSLVMSRCVGPAGAVLAYEPLDRVARRLAQNLEDNHARTVVVRQVGIGDVPGTLAFDDNPGDFNIGKGRVAENGSTRIEVTTVDREASSLDRPVSVAKIDIEEYELKALLGAADVLKRHRPVLLVEFNPRSYTFQRFRSAIPFDASCYRMPKDLHGDFEPFSSDPDRPVDLLVVPAGKPPPDGLIASARALVLDSIMLRLSGAVQ